jgi:hypothetical protein
MSPKLKARIAGLFYALLLPLGALLLPRRGLVVNGDAAATAANLVAHESLFRMGVAADILVVASYLVVTALLYELFKPVNRTIARVAACFSLTGCAVQAFACLFEHAPFVVLGGAKYMSVFPPEQLQAMAYVLLRLYSLGYTISLVFFAFYNGLNGYLIYKSTFLPRFLGVLMMFGGVCWLAFLSPPLGSRLFPYLLACDVGEALLILWLLFAGVDAVRWMEQAGLA